MGTRLRRGGTWMELGHGSMDGWQLQRRGGDNGRFLDVEDKDSMDLSMRWSWVSGENNAGGAAADCEGAKGRKRMVCV